MKLSAIVAVSDNDVIGNRGQIPWKLPADFAYVKQKTMGYPIIMGSKTHDAVGRVLSGRTNIVISRRPGYKAANGAIVVDSLDKALALKQVKDADEAFIFGGQMIFELAMPKLEKIYLTRVHTDVKGDTFFKYDSAIWHEVSKHRYPADEANQFSYDFTVLEPR